MSAAELNALLLRQLECPVCFETCLPPIYMCRNGHIVCAKCQAHLKRCGTCRDRGRPELRCIALEKFAGHLKISCENLPRGCANAFTAVEMAKHLPKCEYGFVCHLCTVWKGSACDLKDHVVNVHPSKYLQCATSGSLVMLTSAPRQKECQDKTYFIMFGFNNDIFWLEDLYNSATRIFSRTLRVVGHEDQDESRYGYSVEFKSKDKKRVHRVFHQADVLMEGAAAKGDMDIVIPASIIESFQDGFLECTFQIKLKRCES